MTSPPFTRFACRAPPHTCIRIHMHIYTRAAFSRYAPALTAPVISPSVGVACCRIDTRDATRIRSVSFRRLPEPTALPSPVEAQIAMHCETLPLRRIFCTGALGLDVDERNRKQYGSGGSLQGKGPDNLGLAFWITYGMDGRCICIR